MLAKLINGTLSYPPDKIQIPNGRDTQFVFNPSDDQLKQVGYKEVIDNPPSYNNKYYTITHSFEETDKAITKKYKIVPLKPPELEYLIQNKIHERYSLDAEMAILRKSVNGENREEFEEYNKFVNRCKSEAKAEVNTFLNNQSAYKYKELK
jgi:hypothetical protein